MLNRSVRRGWFPLTFLVPLFLPVLTRAAPPESLTATEVEGSAEVLSLRLRGSPLSRGDEGLARPLESTARPLSMDAVTAVELEGPSELSELPPNPDEHASGNSEAAFWVAAGALAVAGCVSARKQSTKRGRKDR